MQFQEAKMMRCIRRAIHKGTDTKIWACLVIMVCIFTVAGIVEGEQRGKMNPEIFLPAEAAGWTWNGKETKYNSKTLFDYIDGAAELYLAYGFQGLNASKVREIESTPYHR